MCGFGPPHIAGRNRLQRAVKEVRIPYKVLERPKLFLCRTMKKCAVCVGATVKGHKENKADAMSRSDISTLGVQVAKVLNVFIVGIRQIQQTVLKTKL